MSSGERGRATAVSGAFEKPCRRPPLASVDTLLLRTRKKPHGDQRHHRDRRACRGDRPVPRHRIEGLGIRCLGRRTCRHQQHVVTTPELEDGALSFRYSDDIRVLAGGAEYRARTTMDADDLPPIVFDYAILSVEELHGSPTLETGDPTAIRRGDEVVCLGFPLDFDDLIATRGIVAATRRQPSHVNAFHSLTSIVSDALIQFGSSGGPMIDVESGAAIGVNTLRHPYRTVEAARLEGLLEAPETADVAGLQDVIRFQLKHAYVGLNHAVSVEHARSHPAWPDG